MWPRSTSPSRKRMATLRVGVSGSRDSPAGSSIHLTADIGTHAISLLESPEGSSTSTRKSGSSKSRSRAVPSIVSSSKKRTLMRAMWETSSSDSNGRTVTDFAGAFDAASDVLADGLRLSRAQLARQIGGEQGLDLAAVELVPALHRKELLLEAKPSPVEERLDGAFADVHRPGDVAVAQALQLTKREDQAVLLGQPLGDQPHLPAKLVGLAGDDRVVRVRRRRQAQHRVLVVLRALPGLAGVALPAAQLVVAEVASDGVDPAPEVEIGVHPVQVLQRLEEGLL